MTDNFKAWWATRTLREQRLLLVMAGLAALVLAWLLILRPLSDALSNARERHSEAVLALADIRAQAKVITDVQQASPAALAGPLDAMLSQSANEAGFAGARVTPDGGNRATVAVDAARAQAFFGWVAGMEQRGLIVDRLSAAANPDRTLSVQVTFRARGG